MLVRPTEAPMFDGLEIAAEEVWDGVRQDMHDALHQAQQ